MKTVTFLKLFNIPTLQEITWDWTDTDKLIYKTPEIKLASLLAGKTKIIAKN